MSQSPDHLSKGLERARALDGAGHHEAAVDMLRRAAAAGSIEAASALGIRLLVGRDAPFDPQKGLSLLTNAASGGDADALTQIATLKAAGAWMPQNWNEALEICFNRQRSAGRRARRGSY